LFPLLLPWFLRLSIIASICSCPSPPFTLPRSLPSLHLSPCPSPSPSPTCPSPPFTSPPLPSPLILSPFSTKKTTKTKTRRIFYASIQFFLHKVFFHPVQPEKNSFFFLKGKIGS
jgi:hypothetical protein